MEIINAHVEVEKNGKTVMVKHIVTYFSYEQVTPDAISKCA